MAKGSRPIELHPGGWVSRPAAFKLEVATLDTLDEVVVELQEFLQGHSNSTLVLEAAGHRLINRARQLRQARNAA